MTNQPSAGFRRELARELPRWQADGLVDAAASAALSDRYAFDRLDAPGTSWAATAFSLLGAIAIGAGIISFVAAHWSSLDALARFGLVLGAAVAANATGLQLRARGRRSFAEAAFTCGALAFGGAIALGAQEFNAQLDLWQMYALWAAALIPLAFVLRSAPVATVALAAGAVSIPMHGILSSGMPGDRADTFVHFAIAAGGALLLARRLELLWFREIALALVAFGVVLVACTPDGLPLPNPLGIAIAVVAALALATGAARSTLLQIAAAVMAFFVALPSTFWFMYTQSPYEHPPYAPVLDLYIAVTIVAIAAAVWYVRRGDVARFAPVAAALGAAIVLPHAGTIPPLAGVAAANALLLIPAAMFIRRGLALRERDAFLGGTAIVALLGFLRFAEYDHDLSRKAMAFVIVGAALVACALAFERAGRTGREASHEA
jgi:uncharacterized membrane protein